MDGRTLSLIVFVALLVGCDSATTPGGPADGGDSTLPPPTTLIAQSAPERSVCRNGWCWLSPSPSGHDLSDLIVDDGVIRGVARPGYRNHPQPMIWSEGIQILDSPVPDDVRVEDMTTTGDGWLALADYATGDESQTVYALDKDGIQSTVELAPLDLTRIDGIAVENFVATNGEGFAAVRYEGTLEQGEIQNYAHPPLKIWPNGDLWQFLRLDQEEPLFADAEQFARPPTKVGIDIRSFGPAPSSDCTSTNMWSFRTPGHLVRWDRAAGTWSRIDEFEARMLNFGCDDGTVYSVDADGRMLDRTDGAWTPTELTTRSLNSTVSVDGTRYLAGAGGVRLEIEGDEIRRPTKPFGPLEGEDWTTEGRLLTDLWTDGQERELVVVGTGAVYRKSGESWESMPVPDSFSASLDETDIVGDTSPRLLTTGSALYEWTGGEWVGASLEANVLASSSTGNTWAATESNLFRRTDAAWSRVTVNGAPLPDISDLVADPDGGAWLIRESNVTRLTGQPGDWTTEQVASPPCEDLQSAHLSPDSSFYVAGLHGCVARRSGGAWTRYDADFNLRSPYQDPRLHIQDFVDRPDQKHPVVVTELGIATLEDDGTLSLTVEGRMVDGVHLPNSQATLVAHENGLIVNFR